MTTIEDLDCQVVLEGVHRDANRAATIRSLLPVALSAEDLNYIAVKSAAKWSLASNACKHPIVLEACREVEGQTLGARLSLLEIEAEVYLSQWQTADAAKILADYVRLNPHSDRVPPAGDWTWHVPANLQRTT